MLATEIRARPPVGEICQCRQPRERGTLHQRGASRGRHAGKLLVIWASHAGGTVSIRGVDDRRLSEPGSAALAVQADFAVQPQDRRALDNNRRCSNLTHSAQRFGELGEIVEVAYNVLANNSTPAVSGYLLYDVHGRQCLRAIGVEGRYSPGSPAFGDVPHISR